MNDVTRILSAVEQGEPGAAEQLLPLVYDELRKLAARKLAQEKPGQTLQATALVHEAFLRLVGGGAASFGWNGRGHFFGAAAEAMRRILVENARRKRTVKHAGERARVSLEGLDLADEPPPGPLLALDEALTRLAAEDPQKAELVKLRFFTGLSIEATARALAISPATAKRWWTFARAWLLHEIEGSEPPPGDGHVFRGDPDSNLEPSDGASGRSLGRGPLDDEGASRRGSL
jgi:RNA polymerase sigma factor (TIGR02999 family)